MDPTSLALIYGALVPGLALEDGAGRASRAPVIAVASAEPTALGCRITVRAVNTGTHRTAISRDSEVRSKAGPVWGPWKKLGKSIWIEPASSSSWTYDLAFGCSVPRRYRFLAKKFTMGDQLVGEGYIYFPSGGAQSTVEITFGIGDLDRPA